jgi:uncharacterized repeat protein (TIGR03847 family)
MLEDLPQHTPEVTPAAELLAPIDAVWTVGAIGVAYDEGPQRIVIVAQRAPSSEPGAAGADESEITVRFSLTIEQARAFTQRATEVVAAGRPPCPFCGRPLDPVAGLCPCYN